MKMINRKDDIRKALILFLSEDMRADNKDNPIVDELIARAKPALTLSADTILREYETILYDEFSTKIINVLNESLEHSKLSNKELFLGLTATLNQNHLSLSDCVLKISELQKSFRIQVLEEEIETIQLELNALRKQQQALDNIAKKESNKISWFFALFALTSLSFWAYLVFVKYDWNKMEPWTYISLLIVAFLNAIYYAIFERNLTSENLRQEKFEKIKSHNYDLHKFDMTCFNRIEQLIKDKEVELKNLSRNANLTNDK